MQLIGLRSRKDCKQVNGRVGFIALNPELLQIFGSAYLGYSNPKLSLGLTRSVQTVTQIDAAKPAKAITDHQGPTKIIINDIAENYADHVLVQV